MAQSLSRIIIHSIFSTKNRFPLILDEFKDEMHSYLAQICNSQKSYTFKVGGTADHVHIASLLPRTISVCELLETVKKNSSKWFKTKDNYLRNFSWQAGYGVFSVSESRLNQLIRYIDNQEQHHKKISFKEELLDFLRKYNAEYDERYLWD